MASRTQIELNDAFSEMATAGYKENSKGRVAGLLTDIRDSTVATVDAIADLRAALAAGCEAASYHVRYHTARGDGLGGVFYGHAAAALVDDDMDTIVGGTLAAIRSVPLGPTLTDDARTVLSGFTAVFDFDVASACDLRGVTGNNPLFEAWNFSGLTHASALGPDGTMSASAVTESGVAARAIQLIQSNSLGPGWTRLKFSYLPGGKYIHNHYLVQGHADAGNVQFVGLPNKEAIQYPDCVSTSMAYQPAGVRYFNGYDFKLRTDGWIDVEFEFTLAASGTFGNRLGYVGTYGVSAEPVLGVAMTLWNMRYEQDRVASVMPIIGKSDWSLYQSTDSARPVRAPDIWPQKTGCLVEGYANSCLMNGELPSGTDWTVGFVVCCSEITPSSEKTVFKLTGATASIDVQIDTTGVWQVTRTDDLGASEVLTTTHSIAPVPVAVMLVASGSSLNLYIDGALASGGTRVVTGGTATITGHQIFGADAKTVARAYAIKANTSTAADVLRYSRALRSLSKLPASWPIRIRTGQSNSTAQLGNTLLFSHAGGWNHPDTAFIRADYEMGASTQAWHPGIHGDNPNTYGGGRYGFQREAQRNNDVSVVINCGYGGAPISSWLDGGAMRTRLPLQVTQSLATFGTHLYHYDAVDFIQGEADANTSDATYEADLTAVIAWLRSLYGSDLPVTVHRLNEWLGTDTPGDYTYATGIRSAQDAVAAVDSNVKLTRLDGGQCLGYNVHYPHPFINQIGALEYQATKRLTPRIELINPEYPQRGTWDCGFWDMEHGVDRTGTTLNSVTDREHGLVLAATSTPTIVTTWQGGRKAASFASSSQYLALTDAGTFGVFNGSHVPIIAFLQFYSGASPAGVLMSLTNSAGTHVPFTALITGGTTLRGSEYQTTQTNIDRTIAVTTYYTQVYVQNGTYCYWVDERGLSSGLAATAGTMSGVDRLQINAYAGASGGANMLRRWGVKRALTSDPVAEAIQLHTMLSALG